MFVCPRLDIGLTALAILRMFLPSVSRIQAHPDQVCRHVAFTCLYHPFSGVYSGKRADSSLA